MFGIGKKTNALCRELIEIRFRHHGRDDSAARLEIKNLNSFQLSSTPEMGMITIISTALKNLKHGVPVANILIDLENQRGRVTGSDQRIFQAIIDGCFKENIEDHMMALNAYVFYRMTHENPNVHFEFDALHEMLRIATNEIGGWYF